MLRKVCFPKSRANLSSLARRRQRRIESSRRSVVIRRGCRGKGHAAERSLARESRRNETVTYNFGRATELPDRFGWIRQIREIRKTRGIPATTRTCDLSNWILSRGSQDALASNSGCVSEQGGPSCSISVLLFLLSLSLSLSLLLFELIADLNGTCFATRIFTRNLRIDLFNGGKVSAT